MRKTIYAVFAAFCALILGLTIGLYASSGLQTGALLKESIESQLVSTVSAAGGLISHSSVDMAEFDNLDRYFTNRDASVYFNADGKFTGRVSDFAQDYQSILSVLEAFRKSVNAYYIYTVMKIGDDYRIIFDTDDLNLDKIAVSERPGPFCKYNNEMAQVHYDAFAGRTAAGVMNVTDSYGDFHTGAMPLLFGGPGNVTAIVCADIEDAQYVKCLSAFRFGLIMLIVVLTLILICFGVLLFFLLRHIQRIQDNLSRMAHHDKLTDLPNRRYLLEQLEEMTVKKPGTPFALFFIDLDNFKSVNDNAGHDAGDELLRHIAAYLQSAHNNTTVFRISAGSVNVTARVGGDEFIIIIPGMTSEEEAGKFAQELLDGFKQEHIDKYILKYEVGLSIGIALYPLHIMNFHTLIKYADMAMYEAKKGGKHTYRIYNDEMSKETDGK